MSWTVSFITAFEFMSESGVKHVINYITNKYAILSDKPIDKLNDVCYNILI